jgi:hypothetical protein
VKKNVSEYIDKNADTVELGYNVIIRDRIICVVLTEEYYGNSEGKIFEDKIQACLAYYLNFYTVICFRFKLQLKFKKNKNYSTIIVNMRAGLQ